MSNPKISVVVPVYNTPEQYLKECLDSLTGQTMRDIQIILVDDGSIESCGRVCDEYARKDNRVQVIHQENSGVSAARNRGVGLALAEWILFVDADDWAEQEMCEVAYKAAIENDADVLMFGLKIVNDGKIDYNSFFDKGTAVFKNQNVELQLQTICSGYNGGYRPMYHGIGLIFGKLIKRSLIAEHEIYFSSGLKYLEDSIFFLNILEYTKIVAYTNRFLYNYRNNMESVTHKFKPDMPSDFEKAWTCYEEFFLKHTKDSRFTDAMYALKIVILLLLIKVYILHADNRLSFFQRIKELNILLVSTTYKTALKKVDRSLLTKKGRLLTLLSKTQSAMLIYIVFRFV